MTMDSNGVTLIFGQPQSGKTTRARTLTARCPRCLWYDTAGHDYRDGIVICGRDELRYFWRRCYRGRFRIVYRPDGPTRDERRVTRMIDPEFADVCDMIRTLGKDGQADMTLVVDEVDRYADHGEYDDSFCDLLRRGEGHYGVTLIVATQIPQGIGRLLTSVTRTFDIFQTAEQAHIAYFSSRCGGIDTDDIRRLERYQYIHYAQGADSYWLCKDDLIAGGTAKEEREYLYDRTWHRATAADSGDVAPGPTMAVQPQDGKANLPAPQDSRNPSDERCEGSEASRAGAVPNEGH